MIRATKGISMDGGVLIRYLGKWMTFRRSLGLGLRGGLRWGELSVRWGLESFFRFDFGSDFFRFWVDIGGVLGAPNGPKFDFWDVFFEVFFEHGFGIDFGSIFEGSKP